MLEPVGKASEPPWLHAPMSDGVLWIEAREAGCTRSDCLRRLHGDFLEHARRSGLGGDEGGDPPKRSLLGGELPLDLVTR